MRLFEKRAVERLLRKAKGRIAEAARLAGRNREYFYRLVEFHGLNHKDYEPRKKIETKIRERANARDRAGAVVISRLGKSYFGVRVD